MSEPRPDKADTRGCNMTGWSAQVYGTPVAKGSMKCIGQKAGFHQLVDTKGRRLKEWETTLVKAAAAVAAMIPNPPLAGPVTVDATFTMPRPKTVTRQWPIGRNDGDTDKLCRALLDALTAGGVWGDDTQCVRLNAGKTYPDGPDPDALPRPGVLFRVTPLAYEHVGRVKR